MTEFSTNSGLIHLWEHKFKHSFQDSINPTCDWGNDVETVIYFFLDCHKLLGSPDSSLGEKFYI